MNKNSKIEKLRAELVRDGRIPRPLNLKPLIPQRLMNKKTRKWQEFQYKLNNFRAMLAATGDIDFQCNFDEKGVCRRHSNTNNEPQRIMCCCTDCAYSRGYFYGQLLATPKELNYYHKRWDDILGFWRPGVGCILKREKRSITCVFYSCLGGFDGPIEKINAINKLSREAEILNRELLNTVREVS